MAYNSDGYIMVDFSMVDFRKTNQTIDGLFERCKNVIGANKFVIVINANNKTPLPSTVSITNGQYVIESVLYTFSISSADNLHITKKTTPEELIDDEHVTLKTTWSSNKIDTELDGKQNTLTAGDNITIVGDVINAIPNIKTLTYVGNGTATKILDIPDDCHLILSIYGTNLSYSSYNCSRTGNIILVDGVTGIIDGRLGNTETTNGASINCTYTYDASTKKLSMISGTSLYNNNWTDANYTVYYI